MEKRTAPIQFKDETKVHPALKEYFGYCLFKASAKFRLLMDQSLGRHGLQTHHLGIMKVLQKNGPTSQIQLGEEMGIDKASMVKLIDHLEMKKWVTRKTHPHDRRIKNVQMTRLGLNKIKICQKAKIAAEKKFFLKIKKSQQTILKKLVIDLIDKS